MACNSPPARDRRLPMRRLLLLRALLLVTIGAEAQAQTPTQTPTQTIKRFKDWLAACDNRRTCTVFGFEARDDPSGAYVRLVRTGAADAAPAVDADVSLDSDVKAPRLTLSLVGATAGGAPPGALPAPDGRAAFASGRIGPFLQSLATARELRITLRDGSRQVDDRAISLEGAMAALRFVDALQHRAGGVTAMVALGPAPASSVPPVPALPMVTAVRISQLAAPLPPAPEPVRPSEDCTSGTGRDDARIAFRLDRDRTLWGACDAWGPYNQDYRFYVAEHGVATRLSISGYDVPGEPRRPDTRGILTSPELDKNGLTISATVKDEGLGDCGVATDWVWNGTALLLSAMQAMPLCRGVSIDSWPELYKAEIR